jgi:SAM-dependent methyltransferase
MSTKLVPVIDLGYMPLAGGFIPLEHAPQLLAVEKFFPLHIHFCKNCFLLQVVDIIAQETLFTEYFYRSSTITTLVEYFTQIAREVTQTVSHADPFVVEIGANDGSFISALCAQNIRAVGVDPAENIVVDAQKAGLPIELGYFNRSIAKHIVEKHGRADAVYSFNTLAHIEDMHEVVEGIKLLLKPDGYLTFEIHYVGSIIQELQYDMIYHEHQYYYSLLTLEKFFASHGMSIWKAVKTATHAGSLQISVQISATGTRAVDDSVATLHKAEIENGFDKLSTYKQLGKKIAQTKIDLLKLLKKLRSQGATLAGYGASGRGTIISNYCGLDEKYFDYIIDDSPYKQNTLTPGVHLPVRSAEILATDKRPDYVVLFAWSFAREIAQRNTKYLKNGGKFIVPLPQVAIL